NPALHSAHVAVDAVPADLTDEAADIPKARNPVELHWTHRVLVARTLFDLLAPTHQIELAGQRSERGVTLEALHGPLEVTRPYLEIAVELTEIVIFVEVDS